MIILKVKKNKINCIIYIYAVNKPSFSSYIIIKYVVFNNSKRESTEEIVLSDNLHAILCIKMIWHVR